MSNSAILEIPDYIFYHLIRKFRDIAPNESLGVLYGKISEENDVKKAIAEKIWIPSSKYLENTSTGVRLTEMGQKYHSYIDHFEILSESSAVAWVHSHPIDKPSYTDKTTQKIAQLFEVPYGVYVNYNKLETPRKAIKAFKIENNQKVVRIPIKIIHTKTVPTAQEIEIKTPKFGEQRAHTENLLTALRKYLDSFLDVFKEATESNIKGTEAVYNQFNQFRRENRNCHENLFQMLEVKHKKTKNKLKTVENDIKEIRQSLERFKTSKEAMGKKVEDLSKKIEKLQTNVEENRVSIETVLEKVEAFTNKFKESSKKVISEIKALKEKRSNQEKNMKEIQNKLKELLSKKSYNK